MLLKIHSSGTGMAPLPNSELLTYIFQGTGFCTNYNSFLACRALFGVAMVSLVA